MFEFVFKILHHLLPRPKCPDCDGAGIRLTAFGTWTDCRLCRGRGRV